MEQHKWVRSAADLPMPKFAVLGGHDSDRSQIFVGRAFHEGETLPANVVPTKHCAYVSWGGLEIPKTNYEVLIGEDCRWVPYPAGLIPKTAVRAGNTVDGEPLYVGRGHFEGSLTVGKIHPTHNCLYIPFGGEEHRMDPCEVLVYEQTHRWLPGFSHNVPPNAVVGGNDSDGSTIYVGRVVHEGEKLPAKIVPNAGGAYISFGGEDVFKNKFEYLIGEGYYFASGNHSGHVPLGAVSTGRQLNGQRVYVGRGYFRGSLTPGKVFPTEYCVYIPYGGKEHQVTDYEILIKRS